MRVGILLSSQPHSGGVYQYSLSVLEALSGMRSDNVETIVIYEDESAWQAHINRLEINGVFVKPNFFGRALRGLYTRGYLPLFIWRYLSTCIHAIGRTIKNQKADLWIFPAQDEWAFTVPCRAVSTIHDLMHRYESRFPEVSEGNLFQKRERAYKAASKYSAAILVDSLVGKTQVIECYGTNPNKIFALPYVARTRLDNLDAEFESQVLLKKKYFFYPAQFWQHKNHKVLVDATALLKEREQIEIQWILVGSAKNEYQATLDRIKKLKVDGQFQILGFVDDQQMNSLYKNARALIMPTYFGPTNIPPLEAQAMGCAVAVSKIYGMPEQLGDSAMYFNPDSVEEVANVLKKLWTQDELVEALKLKSKLKYKNWNTEHFKSRLKEILILLKP